MPSNEEFIPLHKLVGARNRAELSPRQARIIYHHNNTQRLIERMERAAAKESPTTERIAYLTALDTAREQSARKALTAALKYYADHGKLHEASRHLPTFAEHHWESLGNMSWRDVFIETAIQSNIKLPPEVLHAMQRERMEDEIALREAARIHPHAPRIQKSGFN